MTSTLFSRRPFAASALLGEPASELALRVRAPRQEDRIIRLAGAKCSIGSGEQCSLRLRAPGVAATHCWILRGPEGVAIRSLGAALRVNGMLCEEARLEAGDTFDIAGISFELLSEPDPPRSRASQRRRFVEEADTAKQQSTAVRRETRRQQHARLRNLLQTIRQERQKGTVQRRDTDRRRREAEQLQIQLTHLQGELSEERNNSQRLEEQRRSSSLHANQLQLTLERLRHELNALQTQQQHEADLFRQERARLGDDLSSRERHVHQLRVDLQQRLWDLEQLRLQLDRQQRQAELDRDEREAAQAQRQQEQELWLSERTRLAEEITLRERQVQQLQADLRTAQTACQQLQAELDRAKLTGDTSERSLTRDLERLRLASEQAQADAATWKETHAALLKESTERDRWARELEAELAQQTSLNERLTSDLTQKRGQLEQLQQEAEELRTRWDRDRAHLQTALDHQQTEESWHAEKVKLLETVTSRDREMDAQRAELQRIVEELAQVRRRLEEQMRASLDREAAWNQEREQERQQAQTQLAEQTALATSAEERRAALEQEMQKVQQELFDATTTVDTWKQAAEDARARIEQLEKKLAAQNAMLANQVQQTVALDTTQSQRYQSLERRVADLVSEKEQLEQRVAELASQAEQHAAAAEPEPAETNSAELQQLAEQREQLASREQELQTLQVQLETERAELERERQALNEQQAALAERESQVQATPAPAFDAADAPAEREQWEQERAALAEEKDQLAAERSDLERVRAQLAEQREALVEQERLLEEQTRQAQAEREALDASRRELAEECQRLSAPRPAEEAAPAWAAPVPAEAELVAMAETPAVEANELPAYPASLEAMTQQAPPTPLSDADDEALNGQTICPSSMDLSRLATLDFDAQPAVSDTGSRPMESVEEVLARLGRQGLWKQESEVPEAPLSMESEPAAQDEPAEEAAAPAWSAMNSIPSPPPAADAGWRAAAASKAVPAEDDEESIDAYMARLMNRVQGSSEPGAAPIISRPVREEPVKNSAPKPAAEAAEPEPPTGEYSPRTAAPEQSHNLAAMRELANESARSAIRTHEKKSGKVRHVSHLLSATVLVLLSAPMLWLSYQFHSWLFAGSFVVAICLATWWLRVTFLAVCGMVKGACKSAVLPTPELPASEENNP